MPILTKTIKSSTSVSNDVAEMTLNMAKALAAAVGSEYHETSDSANDNKKYYVLMDSIGYPGWCVTFNLIKNTSTQAFDAKFGIYPYDDTNKTPFFEDPYGLYYSYGSVVSNPISYTPETCVMISDSSNDTVLFDIHHGSTTHATDLSYTESYFDTKVSIFFGRDVNDEVLCGIGGENICGLRTKNNKVFDESSSFMTGTSPQRLFDFDNVLHLTKMVNYLSPGYPEMKSAYISVVRPFEDATTKKRVSLYSLNGIMFGNVGNTDVWRTKWTEKYNTYFPFNPFVKY